MDRCYKAKDKVTVFKTAKQDKPICTFRQAPYSLYGYDNYKYEGVMYKGFYDADIGSYILIDEPLF